MDPGCTEDEVAKDLGFELSLELYRYSSMSAGPPTEPPRLYNLSISISHHRSRKADHSPPRTLKLRSSPSTSSPAAHSSEIIGQSTTSEGTSKRKPQQSMDYIIRAIPGKGKASKAMIHGSLDTIAEPKSQAAAGGLTSSTPSSVPGLCHLIKRREKRPAMENGRLFYGHIMDCEDRDCERRFGLYAPAPTTLNQHQVHAPTILDSQPRHLPPLLTLRQLLSQEPYLNARRQKGSSERPVFLEFQDQLRLAVIIAVNILHLYSSPWLPKVITLDDILFRVEDEASGSDFPSGFPYRPFIKKSLPVSSSFAIPETVGFIRECRRRETTVFSFGLILIQILLGRIENGLEIPLRTHSPKTSTDNIVAECELSHDTHAAPQATATTSSATTATPVLGMDDCMGLFKLGSSLNDEHIAWAVDDECHSVVKWCLKSIRSIEGLQEERFCQYFYVNVISPLQEALDKSTNLSER